MPASIPLTVIGGFLGAGKTTLLNRVLAGSHDVRFAVMVNDFGDLAIDRDLVAEHDGETITLANGCVCCTLGDNFMLSLGTLLQRTPPPEQILVEASGVADPLAIADMATLHPGLRRDLVIVLVDAENIAERARDPRLEDTVTRQLSAADLILINKRDLVPESDLAPLRQWLASQSEARLVETRHADLPLDLLLADPEQAPTTVGPGHGHHHSHDHGEIFRAVTVVAEEPLDVSALRRALEALDGSVLRAKGFVVDCAQPDGRVLVEMVANRVHTEPWAPAQGRNLPPAALVFIGTADMPAQAAFEELISATKGPLT